MTARAVVPVLTLAREGLRRLLSSQRQLFRLHTRLRPYLLGHRRRLFLAILLGVLYAGLRLLEPWPLQVLFDQALFAKPTRFLGVDLLQALGGDRRLLLALCSASVLLLAVLAGAVYYVQSVLIAGIGQRIIQELRKDLFHQLQRLSLSFHRRTGTGDLLMRLTGDMVLLREMILASLVTLITQGLVLVSVLALMTRVSWLLTLVAVVLAPALALLFRSFRVRMVQAARKQRKNEGRIAASIEEVLLAIPMIQAYTAEAREDDRFRKLAKRSATIGLTGARLEAGMQRLVEIVVAIGTCLVLWFGAREVLSEHITPGTLLVFLAYLRTLYRPVRGISKVAERTARASAAMDRVFQVLDAKREIRDAKQAQPAPALRGEVAFEHVRFLYEDGTVALDDVSFRARAGEHVALVGPTGAGKSTLFSLILRLQRPADGLISIDGRSVRDYTLHSLRRQIAILPQEPFLLGTSVRENLLYGKPEATEEELLAALRAASLEEFVLGLPSGLDTVLASRGQSLSGGQKQRLAIARALLKDAPILLLDEPTTGLDAQSERDVLDALERLRAGRTTLTIAHRFSTVAAADRALVLDHGRLIEDGPPERLLREDSLFRLLADLQGFQAARVSGAREDRARRGAGDPRPSRFEPGGAPSWDRLGEART